MEDIIRAMTFVFTAGLFFLAIMVIEAVYRYRKEGHSGYYLKETLANLVAGFSYKLVDGIAIALFITAFAEYLNSIGLQWQMSSKLLEFLIIFVLADLSFFVMHIAMHKIRWFWAVHVTHHSSDHYNYSTAMRQNFLNAIQGTWAFQWVPLALLGFDPNMILLAIELNMFYQFFVHTETVGRLGWYEKYFNTPSHHRVHHGCNPRQVDRNFAGVFLIWDKLLGTFRDESEAGEIKYGVTRMPKDNTNPWDIQTFELVNMFKDFWRYKDLRIFYKHPDWVHQHYRQPVEHSDIYQRQPINH